jgi:YbbR domain-containing protein
VKLKQMLFGNLGFKLLSVAMAISIWFFIAYRGQSDTTVEAQLEFRNIPKGLEILKQNIKKVNVTIRGHERTLGALKPSDARVVVDLSNGKKGEASYYFDTGDVKIGSNVKVLRTDPSYVRLTLDESVIKEVPVKPYIVGQPANNHEIRKIIANPSSVTVEGARTEMARLSVLRTEPLDVTGLDADITQNVRIDTNGKAVRIKSPEVIVTVVIGRTK